MAAPRTPTTAAARDSLLEGLAAQELDLVEQRETIEALTGQSDVDSLLERELAERALAHGLEVVADIRAALRRIEEGTYGTCDGCGEPIAPARLEAIPSARRCVACQPAAAGLLG